jgi:hypothetical protein
MLFAVVISAPLIQAGDIPGAIGRWTGSLFLPFLISYGLRGRKRDWAGFSRFFFWFGLLLPAWIGVPCRPSIY